MIFINWASTSWNLAPCFDELFFFPLFFTPKWTLDHWEAQRPQGKSWASGVMLEALKRLSAIYQLVQEGFIISTIGSLYWCMLPGY